MPLPIRVRPGASAPDRDHAAVFAALAGHLRRLLLERTARHEPRIVRLVAGGRK